MDVLELEPAQKPHQDGDADAHSDCHGQQGDADGVGRRLDLRPDPEPPERHAHPQNDGQHDHRDEEERAQRKLTPPERRLNASRSATKPAPNATSPAPSRIGTSTFPATSAITVTVSTPSAPASSSEC